MRILTLSASPRSEGNTNALLGWVEGALREGRHQIVRVDLPDLQIGGCTSCYACATSESAPGCVLRDDAQRIFDLMLQADAILFATPLYMWSYSGQLKPLIDRLLCMVRDPLTPDHRSFLDGKRAALLVSCGGGVEGNTNAIEWAFPRLAEYLKLDDRGVWVFPHCTEPHTLPNTHGSQARDMAGSLTE